MDYDIAEVDRLSGTSQEQRDKNFRWLVRQGEQTKIEATKLQTDMIRQHRQKGQTNTPEFIHAMHCLAVDKMTWMETAAHHKSRELTSEQFTKLEEIRIDRVRARRRKKPSLKKEVIRVRFYPLIQRLREKGLSWREIVDYISIHEGVKLAYSYVRESFIALTPERNKLESDPFLPSVETEKTE